MAAKEKQTTTVDPNDSPTSFKQEHEVGASDTFKHPCAESPVDGNYSSKKSYGSGESGRRSRGSSPAPEAESSNSDY